VVSKFGQFQLNPDYDKNYLIEISAFGYQTKTEKIRITKNDTNPYKYSVKLEKIKVGQTVVLQNILFEKASSVLLPESFTELDKLLKFLQDAPEVKIEIAGHTSSEGDDAYNMRLSQERAEAVVFYLTEKGIDKKRIVAKGYGETKPVESNDTEDGRKLNRRVEFKIIE
jgi:outer membrane protein OmpA-like peptidoglycan-associated protein